MIADNEKHTTNQMTFIVHKKNLIRSIDVLSSLLATLPKNDSTTGLLTSLANLSYVSSGFEDGFVTLSISNDTIDSLTKDVSVIAENGLSQTPPILFDNQSNQEITENEQTPKKKLCGLWKRLTNRKPVIWGDKSEKKKHGTLFYFITIPIAVITTFSLLFFIVLFTVGLIYKPTRPVNDKINNQNISQIENKQQNQQQVIPNEQQGIPQLGLSGSDGMSQDASQQVALQQVEQPVQPKPLMADQRTETVMGHTTDVYKRIFVFSDPVCPFCKRLEPMLEDLADKGYEVHIFPTPVHKESIPMINALACANEKLKPSDNIGREKNWLGEIDGNITPVNDCNKSGESTDDASQKAYRFFAQFGFNATPTIVNGYGMIHSGTFNNEDELIQFANQQKKAVN